MAQEKCLFVYLCVFLYVCLVLYYDPCTGQFKTDITGARPFLNLM